MRVSDIRVTRVSSCSAGVFRFGWGVDIKGGLQGGGSSGAVLSGKMIGSRETGDGREGYLIQLGDDVPTSFHFAGG